MKPVDFRNATYDRLKGDLSKMRSWVYGALEESPGPITTRELARAMLADVLTVRPRITELVAMGLVRLADEQPHKGEGVYCVTSQSEWEAFRAEKIGAQMEMAI